MTAIDLTTRELAALRFVLYEASHALAPDAPAWAALVLGEETMTVDDARALARKLGVPAFEVDKL
jgi:hypothetical protein